MACSWWFSVLLCGELNKATGIPQPQDKDTKKGFIILVSTGCILAFCVQLSWVITVFISNCSIIVVPQLYSFILFICIPFYLDVFYPLEIDMSEQHKWRQYPGLTQQKAWVNSVCGPCRRKPEPTPRPSLV